MLKLILQRLVQMVLIMLVVSLVLFAVFDSPKFKKQVAVNELGGFAVSALSDADYQQWLENKGLNVPFYERYVKWVGGIFQGDFGRYFQKNSAAGDLLALALVTGVLAGMREASAQDRFISFVAVLFTSIPEIATAIFLTVIFALGLGWLPVKSKGEGLEYLVLPVLTLVLYDFGYVARMTRASVAEVMTSQYVRTAILKGLPYRRVILKHVLRNALIAPFTVIVLQLKWLLSGVVV